MARWKAPRDKVGPNEQVGRRLFDEPLLRGIANQPSFSGIQLNHFLDKRSRDLSLDRMGQSSLDRKVVRFLEPRAKAHGQSFAKPQEFNGWARVAAKEITQPRGGNAMPVLPSPIDAADPKDNPYHAHLERPEAVDPYEAALHLRHVFTTYGSVERVNSDRLTWRDWMAARFNELRSAVVGVFGK
jgi:hypothetical protein